MEEFERDSCIRGYHVYKEIWQAAVGEELECDREHGNTKDRYAVAVRRQGIVIGHLPRKLSRLCCGGVISCTVTGGRWYSGDLPQGGLEIPCILLFKHDPKELQKMKQLLSKSTKKGKNNTVGNTTKKTSSTLVLATYLWYSPRFFPLAPAITFATPLFAAAITREGRLWDRGHLGSGRPSLGLK